MERGIGVHHANQGHVGEVHPFGDHLGAQQNVHLPLFDALQDPVMAPPGRSGVEIHPGEPGLGEPRRDQLLELLSSDPVGPLHRVAALGAGRRDREMPAAIVTAQSRRHPVQRQRDRTIGTLRHLSALGTLNEGGKSPAIEQQECLLAPGQHGVERGVERLGPRDRSSGCDLPRVAKIHDINGRHWAIIYSVWQPEQDGRTAGR